MKKLLTLCFFFALAIMTMAQAPQKFTYQAVVRDNSNNLLKNTNVAVTVSLLQGSESGNAVYAETHNAQTNANGLMTLLIGGGTVSSGSFADIEWGSGPYFVRVETNLGDKGTLTTVQQLLSVPYAQYANEVGNYTEADPTVSAWAKEANKPQYDYSEIKNTPEIPAAQVNADWNATSGVAEIKNKPTIPTVPTKVSAFENDAKYITNTDIPTNISSFNNDKGYISTEADPSVSAWAKEANKPQYDYSEIKNTPTIPTVPTKVSSFENDAKYITQDDVPIAVSQLDNDSGFITEESDPTVSAWAKEANKPQYDYSEIKNTPTIPTVPTKVSAFENDANYLKTEADPTVSAWAKEANKPQYDYSEIKNTPEIPAAQVNVDWNATSGVAEIKNKPTIPTVPTKVSAFENDANYLKTENDPTVSAWAKEANKPQYDYSEIKNTPEIPAAQVNADWNATSGVAEIKNKPTIPTVPTKVSAFENDAKYITNTDIPTVNDAILTIQQNGNEVGSFTANQSTDQTVNIATLTSEDVQSLINSSLAPMQQQMEDLQNRNNDLQNALDNVNFVCGTSTVKDCDGNEYNTVRIGDQCWMKENLRTTKYPDGSPITPGGTSNSTTEAYYYDYTTSSLDITLRGLLYNWPAVMNGASSSAANPSGVQGICPNGWHVPSDAEWTQLSDYVASQYACGGNDAYIAKALATTTDWCESYSECEVGYHPEDNNATGFSAVPAGFFSNSHFDGLSFSTPFASATAFNDGAAYRRTVGYAQTELLSGSSPKNMGFAVRCLREFSMSEQLNGQIDNLQKQNEALQEALEDEDFVCGTSKIKDFEGNEYSTLKLGNQCWMKENLRATKYVDGTPISQGTETSTTVPYWYYPNNDASIKATYGLLYNWSAVMNGASSSYANPSGVQGICPKGWHVPSFAEWEQLSDYMRSQSQYICDNYEYNIAKALASTTGWSTSLGICDVGNDQSSNNATGFSALPAGYYWSSYYYGFSQTTQFWLTSGMNEVNGQCMSAFYFQLANSTERMDSYDSGTDCGYSVRCLRDKLSKNDLRNDEMNDLYDHLQELENQNNNLQNQNNDLQNQYNDLQNQIKKIECETRKVTDYDDNEYSTVWLGSQCWMKENLRTTKYADGTPIDQGSSTSATVGYWYYPNNNSSNKAAYGLLYNWTAVMNGAQSSDANPSGVQGICPNGWHVPSDAEWTQLTDYVSSQSQYICDNYEYSIAKALASTTGWCTSSDICNVGNDQSSNNATGFGALPAGFYRGSDNDFGGSAYFWSATEISNTLVYERTLGCNNAFVCKVFTAKSGGVSVRCLRDN